MKPNHSERGGLLAGVLVAILVLAALADPARLSLPPLREGRAAPDRPSRPEDQADPVRP